ncbi:LPXTG cell wall anchor domain-containing protein [Streptococcus hillyeri]|uniref:LPXTG cell wall anchor domain-containing protein n=1 Tax=Streptococcus hillyeri TaxID=2282420 RepID=UPI0034E2079D
MNKKMTYTSLAGVALLAASSVSVKAEEQVTPVTTEETVATTEVKTIEELEQAVETANQEVVEPTVEKETAKTAETEVANAEEALKSAEEKLTTAPSGTVTETHNITVQDNESTSGYLTEEEIEQSVKDGENRTISGADEVSPYSKNDMQPAEGKTVITTTLSDEQVKELENKGVVTFTPDAQETSKYYAQFTNEVRQLNGLTDVTKEVGHSVQAYAQLRAEENAERQRMGHDTIYTSKQNPEMVKRDILQGNHESDIYRFGSENALEIGVVLGYSPNYKGGGIQVTSNEQLAYMATQMWMFDNGWRNFGHAINVLNDAKYVGLGFAIEKDSEKPVYDEHNNVIDGLKYVVLHGIAITSRATTLGKNPFTPVVQDNSFVAIKDKETGRKFVNLPLYQSIISYETTSKTDTSTLEQEVATAKENLQAAKTKLNNAKVALENAQTKRDVKQILANKALSDYNASLKELEDAKATLTALIGKLASAKVTKHDAERELNALKIKEAVEKGETPTIVVPEKTVVEVPKEAPVAEEKPVVEVPKEAPVAEEKPVVEMPKEAPVAEEKPVVEVPKEAPVTPEKTVVEVPKETPVTPEKPVVEVPKETPVAEEKPVVEVPKTTPVVEKAETKGSVATVVEDSDTTANTSNVQQVTYSRVAKKASLPETGEKDSLLALAGVSLMATLGLTTLRKVKR